MRDGFMTGFIMGGGMDSRGDDSHLRKRIEGLEEKIEALEKTVRWYRAAYYGEDIVVDTLKKALAEVAPDHPFAPKGACQKILEDAFDACLEDPSLVRTRPSCDRELRD